MKKMIKILALVCVFAALSVCFVGCGEEANNVANNGGVKEAGKIVFGTNAEFPPFEFVKGDGSLDGIDIQIAKLIAADNGLTVDFNDMKFDSLLIALENGQVDAVIAGMTVDPTRAKKVDFSIPYYQATQVMIVKEGSTIAKASDMAGKKIAVIQGYTGEMCVQDLGYEYTSFKNGADAVKELVNGKADVVVIDSATAKKYVADNEGLKIVEDATAFEGEEYAIAVKKGNKELLDKINASLQELIDAGKISELGAQYAVAE